MQPLPPSYPTPPSSPPCRGPSCTAPYWLYSAWSACNATCGGGAAGRNATCEAPKGKDCDKVEQQALEQECNTAACAVFAWQAGEWSACDAECGGAMRCCEGPTPDQWCCAWRLMLGGAGWQCCSSRRWAATC